MSSLAVAVPFGVASAAVFGTTIVVQHRVASEHADDDGESAAGLLRLARQPIFLLTIGGDLIAFLLQIIALAAGPVVVIQPLVVLMLPIALGVSFALGGHRPRLGDYLGCVGVLGGLAVFLCLVGEPAGGHVPHSRYVGMAVVIVIASGITLCLVASRANQLIRGAVYGAVAGAYAGTLAVMVDAASDQAGHGGADALFESARGLVPLAGIAVCGIGSLILTQLSFQVGALGATLPANLAVDPVVAVALGVILLREHVPHSTGHLVAYVACLAAVAAGAVRLADPNAGPIEPDHPVIQVINLSSPTE